jgi:hypothetical protein
MGWKRKECRWKHKYGKWVQYTIEITAINPEVKLLQYRQQRECVVCGKPQDELIW